MLIVTDNSANGILEKLFGDTMKNSLNQGAGSIAEILMVITTIIFLIYIILEGLNVYQTSGGMGADAFKQFWDKVKVGVIVYLIIMAVCVVAKTLGGS